MRFSQILTNEHAAIRRAVKVLQGMTDNAEKGVSIDRHDVNALLIFLHYFADACHQAKEENILFPLLRRSDVFARAAVGMREHLKDLLGEHTEERSLIEKTQIALFAGTPSEFIANTRKLTRMLSRHALEEEQVLFPLAEQIVTHKEADQLVIRMEQADAEFGASQIRLLMGLLEELESKYQPKAA